MEKRPMSKLAVASLIFGILPLYITNICAIVFGALALGEIKEHNLRGKAIAILGICFGIIITVCFPIYMIVTPICTQTCQDSNELSAFASLKFIAQAEEEWKKNDYDGNGIADYWTYDVSCLNRMYHPDGVTKVILIDTSLARADANRAADDVFGANPTIEPWSTGPTQLSSVPRSGYYYQSMVFDENGIPYNQNPVGENKILSANPHKYAFTAYPSIYQKDRIGIRTFIINEKGIVYARDTGGDDKKIVLKWPNDIELKKWRLAD